MKIRLAEERDYKAIWYVFHDIVSRGETYAFAPDMRRDQALEVWIKKPTATYVAEVAGEVAGTYYIKPNQPALGAHVCNCGYMVTPHSRGQGVATAMCEHSQLEARRLGFKAMQFNLVVSTNVGAVRLWQKLGFRIVGTLPRAFSHRTLGLVDAYVMYKWLA
jgi:ribosomal protein S18 acetylase RimI-like enzyme